MALDAVQPQAYFVDYSEADRSQRDYFVDAAGDAMISAEYRHYFCGAHEIAGAHCPNCHKPLLRFLSLDVSDVRLCLDDSPFCALPLLYCWRCPVSEEVFSYKLNADGSVVLLSHGEGKPAPDWPYEDYPDCFPGVPARLLRINEEAQRILRMLNKGEYEREWIQRHPGLFEPRHQYGGEPLLMQLDTAYSIECPSCRSHMPFLASIGHDCLDPRGFVTEPSVQVVYHYCRRCQVVSTFNQCD